MALPLTYSLRNIAVRRGAALLTALGIAMTVAVFAGVLALNEGFQQIYKPRGRDDVAIYLRPGATSEGESGFRLETVEVLLKERPEIALDAAGSPLAAAETYLAVYMDKVGGGVTNVPIRGIQPMTLKINGEQLRVVEGRMIEFGTDEIVVGAPLTRRMKNCRVGDIIQLNVTPFKVVGVYELAGAQGSEVWGDARRMMDALDRRAYQRVVARVKPGTDFTALSTELEKSERTPVSMHSERSYMAKQTTILGGTLRFLASFLTVIMGIAAVLGAMNTMLAAVAARTHEIGVLLSIGFPRWSVFAAFLIESAAIGLVGGAVGIVLVLPFNGYETGAVNFNTFTDVSFAFQLSPELLARAFFLAFVLGLLGGALPALRAAMLKPVDALRQA